MNIAPSTSASAIECVIASILVFLPFHCFTLSPRNFCHHYHRCEHSLGNPPGEAQALVEAARAFLAAEMELRDLNCITFNEHLAAALNSYGHAIRVSSIVLLLNLNFIVKPSAFLALTFLTSYEFTLENRNLHLLLKHPVICIFTSLT